MKRAILSLATITIAATGSSATEAIRNNAIAEDRSLSELQTRFSQIAEKQEESNVFSQNEVGETNNTATKIDAVRGKEVKKIIESLDKVVSDENDSVKKDGYDTAKSEYDSAIKKISDIYDKKGKYLGDQKDMEAALGKQKEIMKDIAELDSKKKEKNGALGEKELDKLAELTEKQKDIAESIDTSKLKEKMQEASESMKKIDTATALKKEEEIVKAMEKELQKDNQDAEMKDASDAAKMEQMQQELSQMEKQLQDSADGKKEMSEQARQEMAQKMDQTAKQMEQQQMQDAAKQMQDAIQQTMAQQDQQALKDIQNAKQQLQQQQQNLEKKLAQTDQKKPSQKPKENEKDSQENKEYEGTGVETGARNESPAGEDWTAKLPEKERAALLSARQAKFNPRLEEEVKHYFTNLAK